VYEALQAVDEQAVTSMTEGFLRRATAVQEPSPKHVEAAVRVYLALRAVVDREELHAVTVRCFDLVKTRSTTACFALAQLNDEGVVAGCEGDVVSAVGMIWARAVLGLTPWMANVARVEESEGALWLAHCTVPRSMVLEYRIRSHFESGLGVGIEGTFATGPVTMLRIGGAGLERLWVAEGRIDQTGRDDQLCRTQIRVLTPRDVVQGLLLAPLGNHVLVLPGHHAGRLEAWWKDWIAPRAAWKAR
jgi:L-fucose isomerase-like protein